MRLPLALALRCAPYPLAALATLACTPQQADAPHPDAAVAAAPTPVDAGTMAAIDAGPLDPPPKLAYQLTHAANMDPSFSPDGARMVYIAVVAGKEQLFVMNADGSHPVQLTRDDADHEDPTWSPSGDKIAFVLLANGKERIHLMNADGTGVEPLTPENVRTIHPHFSPDGKTVAYCTDDDVAPPKKNTSDIYTIDLGTRRIDKRIGGGINTYPAFSPDGTKIAYRKILGEMNSEVFVANADGSSPKNLTNHWSFDGWPAWSPDGTRIAFASNRRSSYQIFVMRADGSDVHLVANTEGRATAPAWAPDGRRIYFPLCKNVDLGADCEIMVARAPGA